MRIRVGHASLQFSDTSRQHTQDIEKIFDRAVARKLAWVTGTEAGPGAGNTSSELARIGKAHGYRMWIPSLQKEGKGRYSDSWIAVRSDLIKGGWKQGYRDGIPGSKYFYEKLGVDKDALPKWGPKGLVTVQFNSLPGIGQVHIGTAHYLTGAKKPGPDAVIHGVDHWEQNLHLSRVIGGWAKSVGRGTNLAFYAGDQNMDDSAVGKTGDTFMGQPLTSLADELKQWRNTGHGPIDVIATYDGDGRVSGVDFQSYGDKVFYLHGDHFFIEGVLNIKPLAS